MKTYSVALEVSGPLAMWSRPDTGGTPTSYPAPTRSGTKGLLESVAFFRDGNAWFHPIRVEICRLRGTQGGMVNFQKYTTNYRGPLRKDLNVKNDTGMQVFATVLADVCYRIYAEIHGAHSRDGRNPRHHLQDLFERRLRQGSCFRTPALGWSEFTCNYWGKFRPEWEVDDALSLDIISMLSNVWSEPFAGVYQPTFTHNVRIEKGVLNYAE